MDKFYDKGMDIYKDIYWDKRDLMLYYLCEFDKDELKIKDSIEVKMEKIQDDKYPRYEKDGDYYILKVSPRGEIARGKFKNNRLENIELYVDGKYTKDPYKLLSIDNNIDIDVVDKIKYFKEYFGFVKDLENTNSKDNKNSFGKYKAMKFYLLVKKILEENDIFKKKRYLVSEPNVFIEGNSIEYDFLILKDCNINKGIYNVDNVVATVELKNSPIRAKKDIWKKEIIDDYLEKQIYKDKNRDVPHIYICGYESNYNSNRKLDMLKRSKIIPFVFFSFNNRNKYYIDEDINLDKIIDNLK